eukprot:2782945-Ditylum_brightwellii.AAC.1
MALPCTHNNAMKKIHTIVNDVENSGMNMILDSLAINNDMLHYIDLGKNLDNQVYAMGGITAHNNFQAISCVLLDIKISPFEENGEVSSC